MSDYTTLTVSKDTLEEFHGAKEEYYGRIADEVSNERFITDLLNDVVGDRGE